MMRIPVLLVMMVLSFSCFAQQGKKLRVLFLGNSYIYVNNMPQLVASIASSMGDTLVYDVSAPGGQTLEGHSQNSTSLNKIKGGGFDYVVLQEQSQRPSFDLVQVEAEVFPFAKLLDSLIDAFNPCAKTMFYMTWGRKNGDASNCGVWPPVCTYEGMDSLLRLRYLMMADMNYGEVAPAGPVWRYLRTHHPTIELYQTDESHPSEAGSYAVACAFYTALFRKDVTTSSYNFTLNATEAANIRAAAKKIVYDSMSTWHIGDYDVVADFNFSRNGLQVSFTNTSVNGTGYSWDFGDGDTSLQTNPTHTYNDSNLYTVKLTVTDSLNGCTRTIEKVVNLLPAGVWQLQNGKGPHVYPNPVRGVVNITVPEAAVGVCKLTIHNSAGQVVYKARCTGEHMQIDLSGFSSGVYLIGIEDEGGSVTNSKVKIQKL